MTFHTGLKAILASCTIALGVIAPAHAETFSKPKAQAAKPAPQLTYNDEKGKPQTLKPAAHKLTIVHFWATWCVPCVKELPDVDAIQQAYVRKGLYVLPLSLDGDGNRAKVVQFLQDKHIQQLPAYIDSNSAAFRAVGGKGLPTTLFIDKEGDIIGGSEGPMDWKAPETKAFIENALR